MEFEKFFCKINEKFSFLANGLALQSVVVLYEMYIS